LEFRRVLFRSRAGKRQVVTIEPGPGEIYHKAGFHEALPDIIPSFHFIFYDENLHRFTPFYSSAHESQLMSLSILKTESSRNMTWTLQTCNVDGVKPNYFDEKIFFSPHDKNVMYSRATWSSLANKLMAA